VLGYFGVVDERMDYTLVAQLADQHPEWSIVMIGPVLKVDEGALPRRSNVHWLGQRAYADLPAFCKGFDLCLIPFALNASTQFINPTKALEYMATGREIVSTAVPDVVRNFGSVVRVADSPEHFVELCEFALENPDKARVRRGLQMVKEHSWEAIVASLEEHVDRALRSREAGPIQGCARKERGAPAPRQERIWTGKRADEAVRAPILNRSREEAEA
jgi:glycosyltransferase involved in cell wall biosynthesis